MIFGEFAISEAVDVVLAHSVKLPDGVLSKGRQLKCEDVSRLQNAEISSVIGARLDAGDLSEDQAATRLANAVPPGNIRFSAAATGRVNVYSTVDGLFVANKDAIDRLNRIDPAITFACVSNHLVVSRGEMIGTFKIIPLAVPSVKIAAACEILQSATAFRVAPFAAHAVCLIATELPSLKATVMDKTAKILEQRLARSGSHLVQEMRVPHKVEALTSAIRNVFTSDDQGPKLIIVFGASAVIDTADVIPEAIRQAGGEVIRVGMPVDPGNLLVVGRIGDIPVIVAPGCARSPKQNGFDWILDRILAGENPSDVDISGMGVGGLLAEISSRPRQRDVSVKEPTSASVAALILAAGMASRMGLGGPHKLLAEFDGVPLVRRCALTAIASAASSVTIVTGHRRTDIAAALSGLSAEFVHNDDYRFGIASSLAAGVSSRCVEQADGALVMLADMPQITTAHLDAMIGAFRNAHGQSIVRAVSHGKRGNPVILPRSLYTAVMKLEGDVGARHIIETSGVSVIDIDIGDGAHIDVDMPCHVIAAGGTLTR